MSEKALVLNIKFFEAFFKVHYTKAFRLTYPIPLPTTVQGIFGSMLGIDRKDIGKEFHDCKFGAILANNKISENIEQVTYIQYGKNRRGVVDTHILTDVEYYLVIASKEEKIIKIRDKIINGIKYMPFGGQNDFFAKDWRIIDIKDCILSDKIGNYLPMDCVKNLPEGVVLEILPVMSKISSLPEFCFVIDGYIISKDNMQVCSIDGRNVALYKVDDFYAKD